ncbi:ABC transporter substrate-binding protein [Mucilaginibacter sp. BT774]|uniref:ABC transporter substrate-binding protein n=1 Tax=Mucilaginibacter sp. BT774 TaxID=3062276 RepID=UPI002674E241|nr:ABC transporter substrate-binding protein [Mucilaginibacter sp. BT774]MDO3624924.1 ABC transporter substrate-binding protein [Mucilaginibacter sp. BT774]
MTLVRNHRLLLSGNKWLLLGGIVVLAACSPKVRTVSAPAKISTPEAKKEAERASEKPVSTRISTISMLLPFTLDDLNAGAQYTPATLSRANLSLDYYQGFKLALDSLTAKGYNYKLQVYDTKDVPATASNLATVPAIRTSDLVVGPVFPDDLQAFTNVLAGSGKVIPTVSPLSPAAPSTVKDQFLVTVATPLEYHAWSAAEYINEHYKPKKVFILKSGYSDDNKYITPFKKGIDSTSKRKTKIIAPTIVRGRLDELVPQLSTTEENVFVVPSTNQQFLMVTLHSLDSLAKRYPVTLFGHPSWTKFAYLKPDLLQRLKTHITTTDRVDYKSPQILVFIRNYRRAYRAEPTHYAMMGFDEGMYFGALLGENPDDLKKLDKKDFSGLLNKYRFIKKPGLGWINTHVNVLQYNNFELKKVE